MIFSLTSTPELVLDVISAVFVVLILYAIHKSDSIIISFRSIMIIPLRAAIGAVLAIAAMILGYFFPPSPADYALRFTLYSAIFCSILSIYLTNKDEKLDKSNPKDRVKSSVFKIIKAMAVLLMILCYILTLMAFLSYPWWMVIIIGAIGLPIVSVITKAIADIIPV